MNCWCCCQLGNTALHYAALNGHMELCKVLIRAGVTRDAHTKVNRTPLHLAAQEGHLPVVELLLSSGADVHATDMVTFQCLVNLLFDEFLMIKRTEHSMYNESG